MSVPFEGGADRSQLDRWDIARVDFDDPEAPQEAKIAEMARVIRRTGFVDIFSSHPEYHGINYESYTQWNETHYQCVTQDCDVIATQLSDRPTTRLSDGQRRLVTAVLGLPRHAAKARIIDAHTARTRYMQVINLAARCRCSLRELPQILRTAASPYSEPISDEYVAGAITAYAEIIDADADDEDGNYHDLDWNDNEDAETTAIRMAEEHLGHREPQRVYLPPVAFEATSLHHLSVGQLSAKLEAEQERMLDLLEFVPTIEELEVGLLRRGAKDESGDDGAMDELEVIELYLEWCINKLDDIGTLQPRERLFVRRMLGLPRGTPSMKIYEVHNERMQYMEYLAQRVSDSYMQGLIHAIEEAPSADPPKPRPILKRDTAPAVETAEAIMGARRIELEMDAAAEVIRDSADAVRAAGQIASSLNVSRSDMSRAVRAAVDHLNTEHWYDQDDDDDDGNDGDIFVA